ncbi:MAG: pentapeptide repeat-containing protein, partial [Pseudomonadota bacterium]
MQDVLTQALTFLSVAIGIPLLGLAIATLIDLSRHTLHDRLGLGALHPGLVALGLGLYGAVALLLLGGLLVLIAGTVALPFDPDADPNATRREYLFYVLRIAGLTTVLGAVIALPFTVIRLQLTQKATETATESLFNDKINEATKGLYARRQVTKAVAPGGSDKLHQDFWQDDIVQRNAAIDRLEGLAQEKPTEVPRIARLLSVYVRELSAEVPAASPPTDAGPDDLIEWAIALPKLRSDMEKAAQTLGRLASIAPDPLENGEVDLRGANLQSADLSKTTFDKALLTGAQLHGANLFRAQLHGANLFRAQLQRASLREAQLRGASLEGAELQGASLREAQLQRANFGWAQLQGADLRGAQLQGASLEGAQLQGANLFRAQLQRADLEGAQLQGANLFRAQLQR